jgi:hypothetical protein
MSITDAVNDVKDAQGKVGDFFSEVSGGLGDAFELFAGSPTPSTLGYGTRQYKLPNNRAAVTTRQIIHWAVPEGPVIQMYVNPKQIQYNYKKDVPSTRTRGGFVVQYFGPQLPTLSIQGTTGTSGIEGINVLYDLYRYEQLAFDPYALYMASENYKSAQGLPDASQVIGFLSGAASNPVANMTPPSLADLAFRVEMFYAGEVYRGFFTDFSVTESADNLGLFDYTMGFTVTQKRGFRQNFLAWHRSANDGPSKTNPQNGVPYSYSGLLEYGR